jgi:hypothetical protein
MKRILFTGLCLIITSALLAQKNKSVFFELAGNGGFVSVNFDSRFNNSEKGLGYRAGFGFIPPSNSFGVSDPAVWTVPVGFNYLLGKTRHYLETGVGATFYFYNGTGSDFWGNTEIKKGTGIVFIPSAGYRYSPYGKAFQGRLFVSPIIDADGASFYWGLSVGFKF